MADVEVGPLLEGFAAPCALVGHDGRLLSLNSLAQDMLGGDYHGHSYPVAFRQPGLLTAIEGCLTTSTPQQAEFMARDRTSDRRFQVFVRPVVLGKKTGAMVTFQDVTAADEMTQIHRDFVANVSHELRTPLTAMMGFLDTLNGPAQGDSKATDRFLGLMAVECQRMNNLVRDLLSLSEVEAHLNVRPKGNVDMAAVVRAIVDRNQDFAKSHGATVSLDCADDLPAIPADQGQMEQLTTNLLENACKYGVRGGVSLVQISLQKVNHHKSLRGPAVVLEVRDQGEGIAAHDIPRLTERFYRTDQHRSRDVGGTGLGLAIVKHIVNRHRGRFTITSELGQGSVFSVVLPI